MRTAWLPALLGILLPFSLGFMACSQVQENAPATQAPKPTQDPGDLRISGPYSHDNLQVFLLHAPDQRVGDREVMTLEEALASKRVVVHETGDVQELAIESLCKDKDIYIQAGDIVRGGKQDRVLAVDMMLEPKSGKMAVASFCVEQGRWSQRGAENLDGFASSANCFNGNALKLAVKKEAAQGEVWAKVAETQENLEVALHEVFEGEAVQGLVDNPILEDFNTHLASASASRSAISPSSLELTLGAKPVKEARQSYMDALTNITKDKDDVVGFAVAINGTIDSAEVYASSALFSKLWHKQLTASATEALAQKQKTDMVKATTTLDADAIATFLAEMDEGKATRRKVGKRIEMLAYDNRGNDYFETRDSKAAGGWLHRSYVAKKKASKK